MLGASHLGQRLTEGLQVAKAAGSRETSAGLNYICLVWVVVSGIQAFAVQYERNFGCASSRIE